jgi:hypothetical protein
MQFVSCCTDLTFASTYSVRVIHASGTIGALAPDAFDSEYIGQHCASTDGKSSYTQWAMTIAVEPLGYGDFPEHINNERSLTNGATSSSTPLSVLCTLLLLLLRPQAFSGQPIAKELKVC